MRMIGLIGGMSWESTVTYYRVLYDETHRLLGGQHNAKSILYTVDFAEIEACQRQDRWTMPQRCSPTPRARSCRPERNWCSCAPIPCTR